MIEKIFDKYYEAILDTDKEKALEIINSCLEKGYDPESLLFNIVVPSIEKCLNAAKADEISLAQHFINSQIAAEVTELLTNYNKKEFEELGRIVIGTSQGDFHGLGKKIVMWCLKAYKIKSIDLGLNVSAETFVEEAIKNNAQMIGISSMMVHTARSQNGCIKVREILREKNLENKIRIIVGGAPYRYDHNLWKIVGADCWAENGIESGRIIKKMIQEVNQNV